MWLVYCLLCVLAWGAWGFLPKLAQKHLDPLSAAVYQGLGTFALFIPVAVGAVLVSRVAPSVVDPAKLKLAWHPKGVQYAVLAGLGAALGGIFYQLAISKANVSIVVVITALYPLITVLLGWRIMGEQVTPRQWAGIALALVAMMLVAQTPQVEPRASNSAHLITKELE